MRAAFRAAVQTGVARGAGRPARHLRDHAHTARDGLWLSGTGRQRRGRRRAGAAQALRRKTRRGGGRARWSTAAAICGMRVSSCSRSPRILKAFRAHAPELMDPVASARWTQASTTWASCASPPPPWAEAQDISIDYAVMERADNLVGRALLARAGPTLAAGTRSGAKRAQDDRGVASVRGGHGDRLRRHAAALRGRRASKWWASA